jgi:uncharacterized protein
MKKEETNLYTITVPPMMKSLKALSNILDTADKHTKGKQLSWHPKGMQESALLHSRLISDQFEFIRQVQVACDNAKNGVARIAGIKAPSYPDNEKTIKELKARIAKTLKFLKTVKPAQVIGQENNKVSLQWEPKKMMTTLGYTTGYLLPNFYFHVTTAYDILRANGLQIGKGDYIGGMPYIN